MPSVTSLPGAGAGAGPGPKRAAETTQTKPTRATSTAVLMSAYFWCLKLDSEAPADRTQLSAPWRKQHSVCQSNFEIVGYAAARGRCVPVISKARGTLAKSFCAHSNRDARQSNKLKAQSVASQKRKTWQHINCRDTSAALDACHCSEVSRVTLTLEAKAMVTCKQKTRNCVQVRSGSARFAAGRSQIGHFDERGPVTNGASYCISPQVTFRVSRLVPRVALWISEHSSCEVCIQSLMRQSDSWLNHVPPYDT